MPERRWLVLALEAPLLAFGGVRIDHVGGTRDFPAASMLTGLLANALGWRRTDWLRHQELQDRLVFAARLDRESRNGLLTDTQNAQLEKRERGWTTWGIPEGRDGASYGAPHRRLRDYQMDASVTVALRLEPAEGPPGLADLAAALDRPARPLFLGRKPCLPSAPLVAGYAEGGDAFEALSRAPARSESNAHRLRAAWPLGEGPSDGAVVDQIVDLPDLRNWRTGLHGGSRKMVIGHVVAERGTA